MQALFGQGTTMASPSFFRHGVQELLAVPNARVTRRNYVASQGTAGPGAHFTWVKDQPGLAAIIAQWVSRQ